MVNIVRNLHQVKQSTTDALKTTSKKVIQKTAEATGDLIGDKTAEKLPNSEEVHQIIIQKQLQMNMIKKYLKKGICLQKKQRKLLMI